jgi:hypothetical protein
LCSTGEHGTWGQVVIWGRSNKLCRSSYNESLGILVLGIKLAVGTCILSVSGCVTGEAALVRLLLTRHWSAVHLRVGFHRLTGLHVVGGTETSPGLVGWRPLGLSSKLYVATEDSHTRLQVYEDTEN